MLDYRQTAAPIIKEFLTHHEVVCGHTVNTVNAYYSDLRFFIGWINAQERPGDPSAYEDEYITTEKLGAIKRMDIYEYLTWLSRDRHLDPTTRARRLSALKALYRYLTESSGYLSEDPTRGVQFPKKPRHLPVYLNEDQVKSLLNVQSGTYALRDRTIILMFITCGMRVSELSNLDLDRVYPDSVKILGKGNKERVVYFPEGLKRQMRAYLDMRYGLTALKGHESALFLSRNSKRLSVRRIQSMVDERLLAANIDPAAYSPHKLRHTAATFMLQNGVDIRVISDVLGHEKLNTTQIYTHIENTDKRLAAATLNGIE